MGLDMYLKGKKYLSSWNDDHKAVSEKIEALLPVRPGRVEEIVCEAGYWRKANAIHKWFVDNVQDGEDNCSEYCVDQSNLQKLLELCEQVLEDNSLAEELLPAQAGFFFGGTDYDEWYFADLKNTVEIIKPLLGEEFKSWSFYYQSSW